MGAWFEGPELMSWVLPDSLPPLPEGATDSAGKVELVRCGVAFVALRLGIPMIAITIIAPAAASTSPAIQNLIRPGFGVSGPSDPSDASGTIDRNWPVLAPSVVGIIGGSWSAFTSRTVRGIGAALSGTVVAGNEECIGATFAGALAGTSCRSEPIAAAS